MNPKGLSPLIATVILIAFVVAIVAITSNFYTSLTTVQKEKIEEESSGIMDCSVAWFEIDPDVLEIGPTISVALENKGQTSLTGLKIVAYNDSGAFQLDSNPSSMDIGGIDVLTASYTGSMILDKLEVTTTACPGTKDSVNFELRYDENADAEDVGSYTNITDGDWDSYDSIGNDYVFMNYTKPANAKGAIWKIRATDSSGTSNFDRNQTIPNDCWKYDPNRIILMIEGNSGSSYVINSCHNSTGWHNFTSWGDDYLKEEAVFWNRISE